METFGKKYGIIQVIFKSKIFKNSVFPELNGKGEQLAVFGSTGPAGLFLSYQVNCGHIADMKTAHSTYHQFPAVC